jgi:predicted component of type VI protein secretion system
MIYKLLLIASLLIFTACGGSHKTSKEKTTNDNNISTDNRDNLNTNFKSTPKTVTIYVHGYRQEGYKKEGDYGRGWYNTFFTNLKKFTNLPMIDYENIPNYDKDNFYNFLTSVDYYGQTPPSY